MVHKMGIYMLIKNIKRINYIIGFTISLLVLYQPIEQDIRNFLNEKKRIEHEQFINSFLQRDTLSFKESKKFFPKNHKINTYIRAKHIQTEASNSS